MIDDNIILMVIYTVLIYCFEHKVIPTLVVSGLALYSLSQLITTDITEANVTIAFLMVVTFFYGLYMISFAPVLEGHELKDVE